MSLRDSHLQELEYKVYQINECDEHDDESENLRSDEVTA
jgi:hypothetical protein